jgi:hypothetical protein
MEKKTSSHIEIVDVSGISFPNQSTIVRPPQHLKIVRCTIIFKCRIAQSSIGYLSSDANQNELNCIRFTNQIVTSTNIPPGIDINISDGLETFVFDRLGVGYMTDNFYVSSDATGVESFVFIWEGITQST